MSSKEEKNSTLLPFPILITDHILWIIHQFTTNSEFSSSLLSYFKKRTEKEEEEEEDTKEDQDTNRLFLYLLPELKKTFLTKQEITYWEQKEDYETSWLIYPLTYRLLQCYLGSNFIDPQVIEEWNQTISSSLHIKQTLNRILVHIQTHYPQKFQNAIVVPSPSAKQTSLFTLLMELQTQKSILPLIALHIHNRHSMISSLELWTLLDEIRQFVLSLTGSLPNIHKINFMIEHLLSCSTSSSSSSLFCSSIYSLPRERTLHELSLLYNKKRKKDYSKEELVNNIVLFLIVVGLHFYCLSSLQEWKLIQKYESLSRSSSTSTSKKITKKEKEKVSFSITKTRSYLKELDEEFFGMFQTKPKKKLLFKSSSKLKKKNEKEAIAEDKNSKTIATHKRSVQFNF